MRAIILAGGLGTRLSTVVSDVPKPMAPIGDKPFLYFLLSHLKSEGMEEVILSVGYKHNMVMDYFGDSFEGMPLQYVIEETPLGTGGAIYRACGNDSTSVIPEMAKPLSEVQTVNQQSFDPIFVLNGDTYIDLNFSAMFEKHDGALSMALTFVDDCTRYGRVQVQDDHITAFEEKTKGSAGWINAGVYLFDPSLLFNDGLPEKFSFEKDFLMPRVADIKPTAFYHTGYFVDIGVPEDYAACQRVFNKQKEPIGVCS